MMVVRLEACYFADEVIRNYKGLSMWHMPTVVEGVSKSAVVVFARELVDGSLELGRTSSPKIIVVYILKILLRIVRGMSMLKLRRELGGRFFVRGVQSIITE